MTRCRGTHKASGKGIEGAQAPDGVPVPGRSPGIAIEMFTPLSLARSHE